MFTMKSLYSIIFLSLAFSLGLQAQQVWDNFEDIRKGTYGFINGTFIPYFENPEQTGANTSRVAAAYTRNPAEAFDVIIIDAQMADLSDYLTGDKSISVDVWSPAPGLTVQITLENSVLAQPANFPTGRHSVYLATTTATEDWETLTFTFDNQPDATVANDNVDRFILLFEPNTNNATQWYFDNVTGPELADDPCDGVMADPEILMDFECNQSLDFTFSHASINFRRIPNPDQTGNTSDYVARYVRNGGEEFDVIIGRTDGMQTVPENATIDLDVWDAGAPTTVRVSLQNNPDDGNPAVDVLGVDAATDASSSWETLNFNFSSVEGQEFNQVVILFDPGEFTSGEYFWDNLQYGEPANSVQDLTEIDAMQVFPNPSTGIFNFEYELNATAEVILTVRDFTGKTVQTLVDGRQQAGFHQMAWDGQGLPGGIYFYSLQVNGQVAAGKLTLVK
jgi:hypothetical protein